MLKQVARWLPGRQIVIVADSTFAALDFLGAARPYATVITRWRLEAALYAPGHAGARAARANDSRRWPRCGSIRPPDGPR